jgi:hypothetical protein
MIETTYEESLALLVQELVIFHLHFILIHKVYSHWWCFQKCKSAISLLLKWLSLRTQTTTKVGNDVGEKDPSYTAGGNVNSYNHYVKQYGGFSKK